MGDFFAWSAALGKILNMDNISSLSLLYLISFVCVRGVRSHCEIASAL
jgi:hypothetical protein